LRRNIDALSPTSTTQLDFSLHCNVDTLLPTLTTWLDSSSCRSNNAL
jgi:hypothetical protein